MKKFQFSLERILVWRRLQFEQERAIFQKLLGDRDDLVKREQSIRTERREYEEKLCAATDFDYGEVVTLPNWQSRMQESVAVLIAQQENLRPRIEQQQLRVREADGRVKLLERLYHRRHSEWTAEFAKEEEAFAAEAHLARCIRLKVVKPAGA